MNCSLDSRDWSNPGGGGGGTVTCEGGRVTCEGGRVVTCEGGGVLECDGGGVVSVRENCWGESRV